MYPDKQQSSSEYLFKRKKELFADKIEETIKEIICAETYEDLAISISLAQKLDYNYTYLSNFYSNVKGCTLKDFIISIKVERVKTYLLNEELTIGEIAEKLHYKSVSHMSTQFKKVTGVPPSLYITSLMVE